MTLASWVASPNIVLRPQELTYSFSNTPLFLQSRQSHNSSFLPWQSPHSVDNLSSHPTTFSVAFNFTKAPSSRHPKASLPTSWHEIMCCNLVWRWRKMVVSSISPISNMSWHDQWRVTILLCYVTYFDPCCVNLNLFKQTFANPSTTLLKYPTMSSTSTRIPSIDTKIYSFTSLGHPTITPHLQCSSPQGCLLWFFSTVNCKEDIDVPPSSW